MILCNGKIVSLIVFDLLLIILLYIILTLKYFNIVNIKLQILKCYKYINILQIIVNLKIHYK